MLSLLRAARQKARAARSFATVVPLVRARRGDPSVARVLGGYVMGIPLAAAGSPLGMALGLARGPAFKDPLQKPDYFYMPGLESRPFLDPDPISERLEREVGSIRTEFAAFTGDLAPTPSQRLVSAGAWKTVPLIRAEGRRVEHIERFPVTWGLVSRLPLLPRVHGGVYFSVLNPGTRIAPHCGPTNLRIRYHLTIAGAEGARIRCGTVWRGWDQDRCLLLDDSFEHEVVHDGTERRCVLIIDCWHPGLTLAEREFLTQIYAAWYSPEVNEAARAAPAGELGLPQPA